MLRASGTPLRTDVRSPGLTGMCLVWHCACSLECDEGPGPLLWSQQLPGARTGHEQTPFAGSRGDWRRAVLHPPNITSFSLRAGKALRPSSSCGWMAAGWAGIGLAPCRGACDLGLPMPAWIAATHLRGMAWGLAGFVQTSGWGAGSRLGSMAAGNAVHWPSIQGPGCRDRVVGTNMQAKNTCRRQWNSAPVSTTACRLASRGRSPACESRLVPPVG